MVEGPVEMPPDAFWFDLICNALVNGGKQTEVEMAPDAF